MPGRVHRGRRVLLAVVVAAGCLTTPVLADASTRPAAAGQRAALGPARDAAASPAVASFIDRTDRAAVLDAYLHRLLPATATPTGWTGNADPAVCDPGTESVASRSATLVAVNYFRDMAGIGPVSLEPIWNAKALRAALMMDAANALDHHPAPGWPCYTAAGAEAAARSNLYVGGGSGAAAVPFYMIDSNPEVSHRRPMLNPMISRVGTGSTAQANALWVVGPREPAAGSRWVAWPPSGFVPTPLLLGRNPDVSSSTLGRWSLSARPAVKADFSRASVTATLGGTPMTVTIESRPDGGTALVWSMRRASGAPFSATKEMTVTVTVSRILVDGVPTSRTWTVTLIPAYPPEAVTPRAAAARSSIAVAWDAARTRGVPVSSYRVRAWRSSDDPFNDKPVASVAVGPSARAAALSVPAGGYWVGVVARSDAGDSDMRVDNLVYVAVP